MAKVTHVHVGMKRKYMHPFITYESFEIEAALTLELEPDEDPLEAAQKSFPALRDQMIAQYKEFKPKRPEKKS
jgi:hypothetical protein